MNLATFFDAVRDRPFDGSLKQEQVDGCGTLIAAFEKARWPLAYAAYGLATAFHETAFTMQPIKERGNDKYLDKYDTGRLATALGNTPEDDDDGILYAGRGYVQLTGRANYEKAGKALKQPLLEKPDLALRPDIAADIMIRGMQEGWFTTRTNSRYLDGKPPNYFEARRIINGTDAAAKIAAYAKSFEAALRAAGYGVAPVRLPKATPLPVLPPVVAPDPPPAVIVSDVPLPKPGFWARLFSRKS